MVDFPHGPLPLFVEIAPGHYPGDATPEGDWTWVEIPLAEVGHDAVTVIRGRNDESSHVEPTQAQIVIHNESGDFTPGNALSPYYPYIRQGLPMRISTKYGPPRLVSYPQVGSRALIPGSSSLNVTNDLDFRIEMREKSIHPVGGVTIIAGRGDDFAPLLSWKIEYHADGRPRLVWSQDGLNELAIDATIPVIPHGVRCFFRFTLDVDNGAGGHDLIFYLGESLDGPWTQIGPTYTGTGTTGLFDTALLDFEVTGDLGVTIDAVAADMEVFAVQYRDGINGTLIVNADFTTQTNDTTSFVDSTGHTWSIVGAAELTNRSERITGTADEWVTTWPEGDLTVRVNRQDPEGIPRVRATVSGILRRLGQGAPPLYSPLRRAISAQDEVLGYWPMEETGDPSVFAGAGPPPSSDMFISGAWNFATDEDLPGSDPLPTMTATSYLSAYTNAAGSFTGQWQVDWYMDIPALTGNAVTWMEVYGSGTAKTWRITASSGTLTVVGLDDDGNTVTSDSSSPTGFDGGYKHMRLFAEQNGGNVDWVFVWFPLEGSGFFLSGSYAGTVGGINRISVPSHPDHDGVGLGHVSVLNDFNSGETDQAALGWKGETTGERMFRLSGEEQFSFRFIGDMEDTAELGVQTSETLLEIFQEAADADGGILYEQPDSFGLIYRTRSSLYNQPPAWTLNAHIEGELVNPFSPTVDDQDLRNSVVVTRQEGSSASTMDETSIAEHGLYSENITLNVFSDSQLPDIAGFRLFRGTLPDPRYPQVGTNLAQADHLVPDWVGVDIGSRVLIQNLPPFWPEDPQVELLVQGYREGLEPFEWGSDLNGTPARAYDVAQISGDDGTTPDWVDPRYLARVDTAGSELDAAITSGQTSFDVVTTVGTAWTTDSDNWPFDINIGGERITVTAVTGATTTQTFTVTRSVNGIVKAHDAGADVSLWFKSIIAY